MSLPDLVSASALDAELGEGLAPALRAAIPRLAAAASASVRAYCGYDFALAEYDELHTVAPPNRRVVLRQRPVASVARVASGYTDVLEVYTVASVARATAALAASTLTLTGWAAGAAATVTVAFAGVTGVDSVDELAAAVATAGVASGWRASVLVPSLGGLPAADLRPVQGARPATSARRARFGTHADDLDFDLDEQAGILTLGSSAGSDPADSPRWGPTWPGQADDADAYGGTRGLRVVYTAGYATAPPDVAQAVVDTVKAALDRLASDAGALKSESDGTLSWTARDLAELVALPPSARSALALRAKRA